MPLFRLPLFRLLSATCCGLLLLMAAVSARAQDGYPNRSILLVQGFGAGGNGDTIARIVAEPLPARLGQPVVVEGRTGAGGNNASAFVARAAPDGHTLILFTGGHAVSAALYKSLSFDPIDDFQMLSTVGFAAFVIAVRKDSPIASLQSLIAAAKADPGKLTFSSVGVGSTQHLAGELLSSLAGIKLTHVPYRGGNAPMTDLLGGRIDVMIDTITIVKPQIEGGTVRALAVTSPKPWWSLPGIAPVADTVPGYDVQTWFGVAAPKGLPEPITRRLNADLVAVLQLPATRDRLQAIGLDVRSSSPDDMRSHVAAEIAKWKKVVSEAQIAQQ
jgi:tripartite-type tricarboxylate transporter receptor subunit TctC